MTIVLLHNGCMQLWHTLHSNQSSI